jgi:hypothetical protein
MSDDLTELLRNLAARFGRCRDQETVQKAADEIERLLAREARLREALNHYSCGCSGPCWYPKDNPSCGLKARTVIEEEKKS